LNTKTYHAIFDRNRLTIAGFCGKMEKRRNARNAKEEATTMTMLCKRITAGLLAAVLAATLLAAPATAAAPDSAAGQSEAAPTASVAQEEENGLIKFPASIALETGKNIVYGSTCGITVTTGPDSVQYIGAAVGVSGAAKGSVYILLPEKVRILLKLIPLPGAMASDQADVDAFNVYDYAKQLIDGHSLEELLKVAEEIAVLLDALDYYLPDLDGVAKGIKSVIDTANALLPDGMETFVWLDEEPAPAGRYLLGAMTLDSNYLTATAVKTFEIKQKSEGVWARWSAELPETLTLTQAQAAAFDFTALVQDGSEVQEDTMEYLYTGWSGWQYYRSSTPPTKPGRYTQRAAANGNYKTDTIRRTFTITE
jgi:hypothetical protein